MTDEACRVGVGDNAEAIAALVQVITASAALRDELVRGEATGRAMLADLERGVPFAEVVQSAGEPARELGEREADPLDRYREARRRLRMAMIEDCLRAGMSRGYIAALLGITRQRVALLAKGLDVRVRPTSDLRMVRRG
jgi:hypothetical protein